MKQVQCNSRILAVLLFSFILAAVWSSSGCGGSAAPPPPPPPLAIAVGITPSGAQSVDQGQSIKFTANVSNDSSSKGVTWSLTQNGSSCSPGCGTISPSSTASGAPATYAAPAAVNANLQFNVTATSVADTSKSNSDPTTAVPPPAVSSPAQLPASSSGQAYSYTLIETGGVSPYTWSIVSGSLPPGLSLNGSTGVISGTSAAQAKVHPMTAGTPTPVVYSFTAQVIDSGSPQLTARALLSIPNTPAALTITTTSLPTGILNSPYPPQTLAATGGTGSYTWSLASGSGPLPSGLTLSSSGVISGTPVTTTGGGTFNFTVQVTDSATPTPQVATATLSIQTAFQLQISGSLPSGVVGVAYNQTLTATGGIPPYTWSITAGALPNGLNINPSTGAITGTPTAAGTANFTVTVVDSSTPQQSQSLATSITVTTASCILDKSGVGPPNSNANLQGTYSYLFKGFDSNGNAVARAGMFTADGNEVRTLNNGLGTISSSFQDEAQGNVAGTVFTDGSLPSSTYCIDSTGHGDLTIGTVKYRLIAIPVLFSTAAQAVSFIEFDSTDKVRGTGQMRLQTPTPTLATLPSNPTAITGGYVFGLSGRDNNNRPVGAVGAFNLDASLGASNCGQSFKISGNSVTITCEDDFNDPTPPFSGNPPHNIPISVTLTADPAFCGGAGQPSALACPRYTGELLTPGDSTATGSVPFVAYLVPGASVNGGITSNAAELFVVNTDATHCVKGMTCTNPNTKPPVLSGKIFSQQNSLNTSQPIPDNTWLGTVFFYLAGPDITQVTAGKPLTQSDAEIGQISFSRLAGTGTPPTSNIAQFTWDADFGGTITGPFTSSAANVGTYTVDSAGRVSMNVTSNLAPPNIPVAYLSDFGTGVLLDTTASAGVGGLLPDRGDLSAYTTFSPSYTIEDVPAAVDTSTISLGGTTGGGTCLHLNAGQGCASPLEDEDQGPGFGNLNIGAQITGGLPIVVSPVSVGFDRFTAGTPDQYNPPSGDTNCPMSGGAASGPCFVGYGYSSGGLILIQEYTWDGTNNTQIKNPNPVIVFWGSIP